MTLAIDLSDHQAQALAEAAARLQVSEAELAAAALRDLIAQPADAFDAAAPLGSCGLVRTSRLSPLDSFA